MVVVSYSGKEINAKLVYYGPGLSGKTTNLEHIYKSVPQNSRGKMVSMKTRSERTLFFDFLPVDLGQLGGFKTRFLLYTVPGQVYYNATRKLVLRGVDALVFVADSERGKMKENLESLNNLRENLKDYDLNLDDMPWVIQYNKRDMDDTYSIEELEKELNPHGVPCYESVAFTGEGVFECFQGVGKVLLKKLSKEIKLEERSAAKANRRSSSQAMAQPQATEETAAETPAASASGHASDESKPTPGPGPSGGGKPAPDSGRKPSQVVDATERIKQSSSGSVPRPGGEPARVIPGPGTQEEVASAESGVTAQASSEGGEEISRSAVVKPVQDKPGFWARLFGKKAQHRLVVMATPESETGGPVKTVTVPVQLSPEDLAPGTQLRLILNIEVQAKQSDKAA